MEEKCLKDRFNPHEIHYEDMSPEEQQEFDRDWAERDAANARHNTPEFKASLEKLSGNLDSGKIDSGEFVIGWLDLHHD